jgi:hypothetical protein
MRDLAQHYGVSVEAVRTLLFAVSAGGGTLAQFDHPELGGSGQWMIGGMTMVGDMFNYGLKAKASSRTAGLVFRCLALRAIVTDWSATRSKFVLTFIAETTSLISDATG